MKRAEIKVISNDGAKKVFVNGVEQDCVVKVENEVLGGEVETVKITYLVSKYEVVEDLQSETDIND